MLAASAAGMAMACPDLAPEASLGKPASGLFRWRPSRRPSPLAITLAAILVIL
jgi:tRNA (Thr-GGU) A37 N-methylase